MAFIAEVIGTMAGFGAATILTPFVALVLDIKTAIALVTVFHIFGTSARTLLFRRHIRWSLAVPFLATGLIGALIGASWAGNLSSAWLRLLFGAFVLAYVVLSATHPELRLPHTTGTVVGGGLMTGVIAGLIGTGGAIRATVLSAFPLEKNAYLGTSAVIAVFTDATRLPVYLRHGWLTGDYLGLLTALVGVAFAGAWVGRRLVTHIPAKPFRWFVLTVLALMGVKLLMEGWGAWR